MSDQGDAFSVRRMIFSGVTLFMMFVMCAEHVRRSKVAFEIRVHPAYPVFAPRNGSMLQDYGLHKSRLPARSRLLKWGAGLSLFLLTFVESNVLFTASSFNDHMSWGGMGVVGLTMLGYTTAYCCIDEPRSGSGYPASPSLRTLCC